MNQIKKNFLYNVIYQILIIFVPLITVPYVSRVLEPSGVGIYSYTYSIVYYFILIAMLGINNYGNRTIAKVKDDKEKLSKSFLSIYSIQLFMTIVMTLIYLIYIFIFDNQYKTIALIQTIYLVATLFDINWFFFGLEEFKVTITRNTVLKLLSLILIFIFVKEINDLWKYTLILSGCALLSQLLLLPFLKKHIKFVKITKKDIKTHIKPMLILFIPVISVSLYKIMDKIMLGSMANIKEVGYYEQAEKIINVPLSVITALGTVMLPRISNLVANSKKDIVMMYIKKSVNLMMFFAFGTCFGMIAISDSFVPLFLGNEFTNSIILLNLISITIIFISFGNITRTQYLIPYERDKDYTMSTILGAVINLVINYLLIPKYQGIGACIGTIFAELFVMIYQIFAVRKELPIVDYFKICTKYFIISLIMFIIIYPINYIDMNSILKISIQVILGTIIYGLFNYKYILSIIKEE